MVMQETLPVRPGTAQWPVWGTTARIVVTDPRVVDRASTLVREELAMIDQAASRFRADSEIRLLESVAGRPVPISPLLAELIRASLTAAERSGGDLDPTIGNALCALGYDRDLAELPPDGSMRVVVLRAPNWSRVRLSGQTVTIPAGVRLDLGATAKAYAADRCARLIADRWGAGALVSLGGDIATAGPAPDGDWQVLVRDQPGEPSCVLSLPAGTALATSSTLHRRWYTDGRAMHHILDPRTCRPVRPVWRTVSVAARSCLSANTLSTAAVIRGERAVGWLRGTGAPSRLVAADGTVTALGGWPSTVDSGESR
jgi:thiamine biosynthesis lipoprotein